ncbi:hypothetical protein CAPTEDRAFT_176820 [Capitella teleta]|uniref:TAP42-like protein n=1 Tax=Capitella teleta TaxID=283909 RepID=R7TB89_CAPTE|nr:hypothetical protein CAPTEDRAFT_176820 [Capitella teleta]|eukprot:ELT88274.1 hypothetical protein CAPTEDRAFT_176820 [Capitella teleta]
MAGKENENGPKLSEIFSFLLESCEFLDTTSEPTVSDKVQNRVKKCMRDGERAIQMTNELSLFSVNEDLEEIATADMKYLLLPAFLAFCSSKNTAIERMETVRKSQDYYRDFVRLCKNYDLTNIELKPSSEEDAADMRVPPMHGPDEVKAMAAQRQEKIARFRKQKETENQLKEMQKLMEKEFVDDEIKRKFYLTLIDRWVIRSQEEMESLSSEVQILKHMQQMRASGQSLPEKKKPADFKPNPNYRPIIITKDMLQKKVFGAGYPSLPTYTVEEWFDQQVAQGNMPQPDSNSMLAGANAGPETEAAQIEEENAEKEKKIEEDDEETLLKARNMDDWKDDHRRGWGNTHNKG